MYTQITQVKYFIKKLSIHISFQLFSALFFVMMTVLGIGSGVALHSVINTILMDAFPKIPITYMSLMTCSCGFLVGLVYVTPVSLLTIYFIKIISVYYMFVFMHL